MAVRDEHQARAEAESPRQSGVSAERQLQLRAPVEGTIADGPVTSRTSAPAAAVAGFPGSPLHHHHRASAVGMRVLFVTGVVTLTILPIALQHPEAPDLPDAGLAALLTGMATLKSVATLIACVAVMWRLKRHASAGRRSGYLVGPWLMAFGVGLIVSATLPFLGALAFDAGLVLLLALAVSDERLRRGRSR